ncbi:MAG: NAD-dependent epimerase/dehydratase family protein [Phaeodactylibacter sp.]|nr:NAD-dependent epimerase/dehydratase family protein [Phaeodactylibacter sp.]MCB9273610.1 NAD-dependent epimerase/dehydratase family protein [Lewinellaceae bacterium]
MQTILGAGGAIGNDLARALKNHTTHIRLVGRNPKKVNDSDELFPADLTDPVQVDAAVAGSEVVYLLVGLEYKLKVWRRDWPPLMRNVIMACEKHDARLVFFDNIYMYDIGHIGYMTEETPINPPSRKGRIRAQLVQMITDEIEAGRLTALIARAADFYGPGVRSSVLQEMVPNNFRQGKKANWFASVEKKHSFTYTPDAARATAILGNTPDAFNQAWHMPTASPPWTGRQFIEAFAREMEVEPRFMVVGKFMLRILGLFIPIMKEFVEMIYQYDRDYVFDSSKFEQRFGFTPTPYEEGVKAVVAELPPRT